MEFSVSDRLWLLQILPKEGNLTTLRLVRAFREDLSFLAEEHEVLKFKNEGDAIHWDASAGVVKEIAISEPVMKLIEASFETLDKAGKLTLETAALYERFLTGVK